jgi:hypothetical protein
MTVEHMTLGIVMFALAATVWLGHAVMDLRRGMKESS